MYIPNREPWCKRRAPRGGTGHGSPILTRKTLSALLFQHLRCSGSSPLSCASLSKKKIAVRGLLLAMPRGGMLCYAWSKWRWEDFVYQYGHNWFCSSNICMFSSENFLHFFPLRTPLPKKKKKKKRVKNANWKERFLHKPVGSKSTSRWAEWCTPWSGQHGFEHMHCHHVLPCGPPLESCSKLDKLQKRNLLIAMHGNCEFVKSALMLFENMPQKEIWFFFFFSFF